MRATASRVLRLAAMLLCLAAARAVQQNLHVEHEGRTWQWSELVRALDGYITIVDRGRHSRFWNFMAAWYQDPDALAAAAVEADDATATMDEGGDDDDAEAAANLAGDAAAAAAAAALGAAGRARRRTPSTILVDDWVALWISAVEQRERSDRRRTSRAPRARCRSPEADRKWTEVVRSVSGLPARPTGLAK